ncbi:alpha/beta hydrolase [Streptomyces sp. NPDC088560]|uniref:alpha/beta hydrolase n=1 Tax=Streptomyces sp. NPDC088560 TaxID=3365868 RepID=UPI00380FA2A0
MNRTPVVFIHGAWLHALSWESWAERFASRGFLVFTPGWPGEASAARTARSSPETLGDVDLEALTDHYAGIVRSFDISPVIIGHSVGGLIAQHLIGANVGQAAVAIAPAPINGIRLPTSPAGLWTPPDDTSADSLISLSPQQFNQVIANRVGPEESGLLFERYVMPTPRRLLADLGCAGTEPSPSSVANTGNARRGPLLLISGQEDRLVPDAVTRAVYKLYGDSTAMTDLKQFADRAHSLVIDSGWRLVADYILGWLNERGIRAIPPQG